MKEPFTIALEEQPKSEDLEVVRKGLASCNRSNAPDDNHQRLSILLRDDGDLVIGGALGGTYWGRLLFGEDIVQYNLTRRGDRRSWPLT
jgi:hypothetical protein